MLIDLHAVERLDPDFGEVDVCIVGAGVAGISLARRLAGRGKRILLLESGGTDYEADVAAMNAGANCGRPYYDLEDARLRLFGGTAAIWGGRCAELDDIDFEPREWVQYSGWPFGKAALATYYAEARAHLQLDPAEQDERLWQAFGVQPPCFGQGVLATDFWQFDDRWDRFGFAANRDLSEQANVTSVLHASVVALHLNESGSALDSIDVATLRGVRSRIRARAFVLAAGGIENPRLLLASQSRSAKGVGNDHDVVGRYFMEHPHARGGRLHVRKLWQSLRSFRASHWHQGYRYAACLRPDDRLQREHRILNSSFTPRVRPHPQGHRDLPGQLYKLIKERAEPTRRTRLLWQMARSASRVIKRSSDPLKPWLHVRLNDKGFYLSVRAEQAPNPDSRVRLSDERDALGMPKVALDWRFSEIDKRTVRVLMHELDRQMRRDGDGHVEPAAWLSQPDVEWEHDPLISQHAIGGYHHMGSTRISTHPRFGVVDANCRVHGVANLFIAGSSVFPTSGWANPTLTILALSLRLGDHLLKVVEPAPAIETLGASLHALESRAA